MSHQETVDQKISNPETSTANGIDNISAYILKRYDAAIEKINSSIEPGAKLRLPLISYDSLAEDITKRLITEGVIGDKEHLAGMQPVDREEFLGYISTLEGKLRDSITKRLKRSEPEELIIGDIVKITAAKGPTDIMEMLACIQESSIPDIQNYFYGGDTLDIPLLTEAEILSVEPQKILLTIYDKNDKRWITRPDEISGTGENKYEKILELAGGTDKYIHHIIERHALESLEHLISTAKIEMNTEKMVRQSFIDFPKEGLPAGPVTFCLYSAALDRMMVQNGRPDITQIRYKSKLTKEQIAHGNSMIHHPTQEKLDPEKYKRYAGQNFPCAMQLDNLEELEMHISRIYQISHAYSVYAQKNYRSWPKNNCVFGADGMFYSMLKHGYLNVTKYFNYNHNFNIAPFTIKDPESVGIIMIDTTSQQMWPLGEAGPRNYIYVAIGGKKERWRYYVDGGSYPLGTDAVNPFITYPIIRSDKGQNTTIDFRILHDNKEFYDQAFSNSIKIPIW